MNEFERNELLVEIKTKLDNLMKAFEKVSNGTGFPRCVEREQRIRRLEDDVIAMKPVVGSIDLLARSVTALEVLSVDAKNKRIHFDAWLIRLTWAVIIVGVIKYAFFNEVG